MLLGECARLLELNTLEDFGREVVCFAKRLGFDTINATAVLDKPDGSTAFAWVDNNPAAYRPYANDFELARCDPVSQHCKRSSRPIIWDRGTYVASGADEKWEMQASFGYRAGIAVALHLPRGAHFLVGVDRDGPLPRDPVELARMTGALQLFICHAQESGFCILMPDVGDAAQAYSLSPRELESLRWTMEGKTAWEVGHILGISEQTAARHLCNAARKLDCTSKHHAVVKALKLGLIQ